jgi:hypothetical protein
MAAKKRHRAKKPHHVTRRRRKVVKLALRRGGSAIALGSRAYAIVDAAEHTTKRKGRRRVRRARRH